MNWREFKEQTEGIKGFKVTKSPSSPLIIPLKPLIPGEATLEVEGISTESEMYQLIEDVLVSTDRSGRPWTGWYAALTSVQREQFIQLGQRIDDTYASLDRSGLVAALTEYRTFCLGKKGSWQ